MINKDFNSIEIPRRVTRFANFVMIKSSIKLKFLERWFNLQTLLCVEKMRRTA